ncbi:MAG: hypothetical protein R2867_20295 [Caldilineaceae bacterium]
MSPRFCRSGDAHHPLDLGGGSVAVPWRDGEEVTIGKKTRSTISIGIQGNWQKCTSCHTGYGWSDASYDFDESANVDCLACHANTSTYAKGALVTPLTAWIWWPGRVSPTQTRQLWQMSL